MASSKMKLLVDHAGNGDSLFLSVRQVAAFLTTGIIQTKILGIRSAVNELVTGARTYKRFDNSRLAELLPFCILKPLQWPGIRDVLLDRRVEDDGRGRHDSDLPQQPRPVIGPNVPMIQQDHTSITGIVRDWIHTAGQAADVILASDQGHDSTFAAAHLSDQRTGLTREDGEAKIGA